ncbi:metal ABC transporter substrate-binding protein [Gymnodinialimonas sp.]
MTTPRLTRRTMGSLTLAGLVTFAGRATAQDRLSIAAVNYPLAYFAERIAGDLADVSFTVPNNVDPSFWRPGIADISAIQAADLILLNGAGFADWTARTTLPRSRSVMTSAAFEDAFIATETITHSHGEGGQHSHTGVANYLWLDFAQAQMQAAAIAAALTRRAPEAEAEIARNLAALVADLEALDVAAQDAGEAAQGIAMIAAHPRYQYFARAYGMDIDAVEWDPREPVTAAQLSDLEGIMSDNGARLFIWEAEPDAASRAAVEDLGLVSVVIPPLANRPTEGDFLSAMGATLDDLRAATGLLSGG